MPYVQGAEEKSKTAGKSLEGRDDRRGIDKRQIPQRGI